MSFSPVTKIVAGTGVTLTPPGGQGVVKIDVTAGGLSGLTATDVLYATSPTSVGQDGAFTYDAASHVLTVPQLYAGALTAPSGGLTLGAPGSITFAPGANIVLSGFANGFVKTGGGTGTLAIDTNTYLTSDTQISYGSGSLTVGDGTGSGVLNLHQFGGGGNITVTGGPLFLNDGGASYYIRLSHNGSPIVDVGYTNPGIFVQGTNSNLVLWGTVGSAANGGKNVIFLANRNTAPTSTPTGGGILYAEAGALKWIGSSGTTTTIAPA